MKLRTLCLASLSYFSIVFGAGFALGTVRVLVLVPQLGERFAELLETPLMIAVSYFAAGYVNKRFSVINNGLAFAVGLLALALLLTVEFSVVLGLRGLSIAEYFATRDPISGSVYAISLVLFSLFPLLRLKR